uniref:Oleosin n=1 Tax=Kalanchoe fedtschenkoi TaxID=63787 RepID=A0A7N0RCU5_KALFE
MSTEHSRPFTQKLYDSAPGSRQTVKFLTAATTGASLLVLSGLVLTATIIGLVVATPLLVIFSPVLVPAAVVLFLTFVGFVSSGGFGLAAVAALGWIYNYVAGKHPPGADKLDYARAVIADKTRGVAERARDYGHAVQHKVQDAAHHSS